VPDSVPTKKVFLLAEQLRSKIPGGIGTHTESLLKAISHVWDEYPSLDLEVVVSRGDNVAVLDKIGLPIRKLVLSHQLATGLAEIKIPYFGFESGVYHSFSIQVPPVLSVRQKAVVTVHDIAFISNPQFYTARGIYWHKKQLEYISKGNQTVVSVSEKTRTDLIQYGISPNRIEVIESGADHLDWPDFEECRKILTKQGVQERFILSVSTIEPRKNLPGLIAGYKRAVESFSDLPELVVVGPEGWGTGLDLSENVHLLGSVPGPVLSALYRKAEMLVYVPLDEGFGLPVVEAMSVGLPVVSSDVPAASGCTELAEPRNESSISQAIIRVLKDGELKKQLVSKGLKRAAQLTWMNSARKHLELWDRIQ
jgi:glycosyltransferase involved in cell wall biosynthesis